MSLSGMHSPRVSMSSDFSSNLSLGEYEREERRRLAVLSGKQSPSVSRQIDEHSQLLPLAGDHKNDGDGRSAAIGIQARPILNATLLLTITVVTIGSSFQFGYATGVMNNSAEFIRQDFHNRGLDYSLVEWSTTVSCYGVGGLLGAIIGPKVIGHYCGRRATLLWNNVFLVISSFLIAFAPVWWCQAIGRIFVGVVAGVATAVVPTYFSEISPIAVRGAVGTMHQLGITVGILVSQVLSTPSLHLLGSEERWQWLFLVPVICGLIEVLMLPFLPESPSYLYTTQGKHAARQALVRLQCEEVADEYLGYIKEEISADNKNDNDCASGSGMTMLELFRDRSLRKQLIVGVTVQLMMQFSGIDAVFYYSTRCFYKANVADPELATTCLGVINVIVTIFAVKGMDTAGRKTLLRYSWIGMFISYLVLTASFIFNPYLAYMDQLSVVSMTGVIIFFAFGPGCIAWFIIAEIFPLYARDTAMAFGIFVNWIANWLVAFTFPILLEYTQPYTFLVFVATTGFFLYFTICFVPETKGLTVAQVTEEFERIDLSVY